MNDKSKVCVIKSLIEGSLKFEPDNSLTQNCKAAKTLEAHETK